MTNISDLAKAVQASRHFEILLRDRYRARGNGLGSKTRSVRRNLQPNVAEHLLYLARVRNTMVHEKVDSLPDKRRFDEACAALEAFFKEAITTTSDRRPTWTEELPLGFWPRVVASSQERRLYTLTAGHVIVHPSGHRRVRRTASTSQCGLVWMLPQSLPRMDLAPLRSKDGLEIRMSVEASASVLDSPTAIIATILNEDQQVEALQSHVLIALQAIASSYEYDYLAQNLHVVAQALRKQVNEKEGVDRNLVLADCAVVECELEDTEIEEMRRRQQRSTAETKQRVEEHRHLAELELVQRQLLWEKADLERRSAVETQKHETAIENLKATAQVEKAKIMEELQRTKAALERELAVEASRRDFEVQSNRAKAGLEELAVAKAKAELASTPAGKTVLFPDQSFGLDRLRLNREAEFWRANFSDRKVQQLLDLAVGAGFSQAELQSLKSIVTQMSSVALTQRPLALQEGENSTDAAPASDGNDASAEADGAEPAGEP